MTGVASFEAALQLLIAFGDLLQVIVGFLMFLSAFLALLLIAFACIGMADSIRKAYIWIAARAVRLPARLKAEASRWELRSKATHA